MEPRDLPEADHLTADQVSALIKEQKPFDLGGYLRGTGWAYNATTEAERVESPPTTQGQ